MTDTTETEIAPDSVEVDGDGGGPIEARFFLLDPSAFRTARAASEFVGSDAFDALLAAISASTCPCPDPLPEGVEELATSKVWLIAEDLKTISTLAQYPPATRIDATLDDDDDRLRMLSLFAVVLAHSEQSQEAFELYRMTWGDPA